MKKSLLWNWKWHRTYAFGDTVSAICFSKFPIRTGLQKMSKCALVLWAQACRTDWHVTACIIFLNIAQDTGTPVICYRPRLSKNKLGNKVTRGNEGHLEIWEPTHSLWSLFCFWDDFKVSTCFNASPPGCFINENSSIFYCSRVRQYFPENFRKSFWIWYVIFSLSLFLIWKKNPNWRAFEREYVHRNIQWVMPGVVGLFWCVGFPEQLHKC